MAIYAVEKDDSYGTRRAEITPCAGGHSDSEYDLVFLMDDYNDPSSDGSIIDHINIKAIMNKLRNNIMPNCIMVYNTLNVSTYAGAVTNVSHGIVRKAVAVNYDSNTNNIDVSFVSFAIDMLRTHILTITLNAESVETNEYDRKVCNMTCYYPSIS